jgi:undecaprenyl pyrophosphate phosphatase UppP
MTKPSWNELVSQSVKRQTRRDGVRFWRYLALVFVVWIVLGVAGQAGVGAFLVLLGIGILVTLIIIAVMLSRRND